MNGYDVQGLPEAGEAWMSDRPPGLRYAAIAWLSEYWIAGVFALLVILFTATARGFVSSENWVSTAQYTTEYLLLALGELMVIATAGIDLSVGATLGLSGVMSALAVSATTSQGTAHPVVGLVAGLFASLATGALVGLFNGMLITRLQVTPFIATLGSLGMVSGITFLLTNGNDVTTVPQSLGTVGNHVYFGIFTVPVLATAVVAVLVSLMLSRTRFGLRTYALGSNVEAARRTGINVNRHLLLVYMAAGVLAGMSGFLVLLRFVAGSPIAGTNDELSAIAAVVIGGASLFGGTGTVLGTAIGSLLIATLVSGLILLNVQAYWQTVLTGAIIVVAVAIDQRRRG